MSRSWYRRVGAATLTAVFATGGVAAADPSNNNSEKLRAAVSAGGILEHERALGGISASFGGNRLSGAPGYDQSAAYVAQRAAAAGMSVSSHSFSYPLDFLADFTPPQLAITAGAPARAFVPGIAGASLGGDFGSMYNSRSTDVTRPVFAVDLNLDAAAPVNTSTSGCQASDYNGMPAGAIALVQRGTCTFAQKFKLANRSGAGGMILFNEGQPPDRTVPLWFDVTGIDVPSMAATFDTAVALADGVEHGLTGVTAHFKIDWRPGTYPTSNVIADTASGDPDNVIVVGAHLDSVGVGAGLNDNGSGSAGILEIAEQLSGVALRNKIRFVWFGAEESGLLGSEAYVASLSPAERARISAMLNFDMIGSPNFVRFVYDGDLSDSEPPEGGAPAGSAEIEDLFLDYFAGQGLETRPTAFDGRSDYGPFIEAGIPAGGLFTGAEGIKTAEEAAVFGGTAGRQYDPCYHLGCDGLSNLSTLALEQMADAAAHATITMAQANAAAGGPRGRAKFDVRGFPKPKPQNPNKL